jgi:hypothetical protein
VVLPLFVPFVGLAASPFSRWPSLAFCWPSATSTSPAMTPPALNSALNQVPVLHAVPRLCSASNISFPSGQSSAFLASPPCVIFAGRNWSCS